MRLLAKHALPIVLAGIVSVVSPAANAQEVHSGAPAPQVIIKEVQVPGPERIIIKEVKVPSPPRVIYRDKEVIREVRVPGPERIVEVQVPGPERIREVIKVVQAPPPKLPDSGPGIAAFAAIGGIAGMVRSRRKAKTA